VALPQRNVTNVRRVGVLRHSARSFVDYARCMTRSSSAPADQRVKIWNQLTATSVPFQVESIKIIESNVLTPQTIELDRVVAFIGLHGAGKTLLLRMLEASFGYTTPVYSPPFLKGAVGGVIRSAAPSLKGVVEIRLRMPSGLICRTVDLSEPSESRAEIWRGIFGESFAAWYVDPVGTFWDLNYMNDNYDFTSRRTENEVERKLTRADLDLLNNILGRRYDTVTVRTGLLDSDDYELPFISARSGSKVFDNTTMSQGELWVHFIHWLLEDKQNKGHLALIDEPESFLAAQGRRAFIDSIARSALRNDRQFIIGTHSPEILSRFPLANVRMCISGDSGTRVITPRSIAQIHDCVGIQTPIRGIILVEDELAKQLLSAIFVQYDTALTREIEIISAGGVPEVINGYRVLRKAAEFGCFAVLDGDQRSRRPGKEGESIANTLYFLPGAGDPESELMTSAQQQIDWLAEVIGIHADQIYTAINSCQYLDHQYRLGRIAEQLGYREGTLMQFLIRAWLRREDVTLEAERLARDIRHALSKRSQE
jgi:hypothetical protein